jgi:hypothetical protein
MSKENCPTHQGHFSLAQQKRRKQQQLSGYEQRLREGN